STSLNTTSTGTPAGASTAAGRYPSRSAQIVTTGLRFAVVSAVAGSQPPRLTPVPAVHSPAATASTAAAFTSRVRVTRRTSQPSTPSTGAVPTTKPAITAAPANGDPLEIATSSMPIVTPHGTRIVAAPSSGGPSPANRWRVGSHPHRR